MYSVEERGGLRSGHKRFKLFLKCNCEDLVQISFAVAESKLCTSTPDLPKTCQAVQAVSDPACVYRFDDT